MTTISANATIVVRGKAKQKGNGDIVCKGNEGVCARIEEGPRVAEFYDTGRSIGKYSFTEFRTEKTKEDGEDATLVILVGAKKL